MKQAKFFKNMKTSYGGSLRNTRKGREGPRPLSTRDSMHLVLRSSKAKGNWSLRRSRKKIDAILDKFSSKYAVNIISQANVGNHLHLHLRLRRRRLYNPFIRAITAAIAMAATGASRWKPLKTKFWITDHFLAWSAD